MADTASSRAATVELPRPSRRASGRGTVRVTMDDADRAIDIVRHILADHAAAVVLLDIHIERDGVSAIMTHAPDDVADHLRAELAAHEIDGDGG